MGFVTAAVPRDDGSIGRKHQGRWYAVLHKFDPWGKHIGTEHWFSGTCRESEADRAVIDRADEKLDEMIRNLGKTMFCDIEVELFKVEVEGCIFGLIDDSDPESGIERITLIPNELAFFPPWNGDYSS